MWLLRGTDRSAQVADETSETAVATAGEVLAQRFARGEIDEDEFIRRRAVLEGTRTGP